LSAAFDLIFFVAKRQSQLSGDKPKTKINVKPGGQECPPHTSLAAATGRLILGNCRLLLFQKFDALGKSQIRWHGMEITVDLG
jgi:hypothetical protein